MAVHASDALDTLIKETETLLTDTKSNQSTRLRRYWAAGVVATCVTFGCIYAFYINRPRPTPIRGDGQHASIDHRFYFDKSIASYLGVNSPSCPKRLENEGIQILVLAIPISTISRTRVEHMWESLSDELKCVTRMVHGISYKDYPTVYDLVNFDRPDLVNLTDKQKENGFALYRQLGGHRWPLGAFCCSAGHLGIWSRATEYDGWTVVLEDDAELQSKNWTLNDLKKRILEDREQMGGVTWLEGRPCSRGYGLTAYAINQTTAKYFLEGFQFQREIDCWLVALVGTHHCDRPPHDYTFNGWGVNPAPANFSVENSRVSQIWDDELVMPVGSNDLGWHTVNMQPGASGSITPSPMVD